MTNEESSIHSSFVIRGFLSVFFRKDILAWER